MEPYEAKIIGYCAYCGDEIYEDESYYQGDEGKIHKECLVEFITEMFTPETIARKFGYEQVDPE